MNPDALEAWNMLPEHGRRVYPRPEAPSRKNKKKVKILLDNARGCGMDGDITGEIVIKGIKETQRDELARLRNRHVAKILSYLGETPPYLESAIKKAFTMFADDVSANIINSETQEHSDGRIKP